MLAHSVPDASFIIDYFDEPSIIETHNFHHNEVKAVINIFCLGGG